MQVDTTISSQAGTLLRRYDSAKRQRSVWEGLWQDCYEYALPQRSGGGSIRKIERLYDATALDAVDQLASSMIGYLAPPGTPWIGLKPGTGVSEEDAATLAPLLENAARVMNAHFDHSNFAVEIHQAFLDLVVGDTDFA